MPLELGVWRIDGSLTALAATPMTSRRGWRRSSIQTSRLRIRVGW